MRKVLHKDKDRVIYIAHTNKDFEEFDTITELANESNKYLTLFVYNRYYNCIEPFSGYPVSRNPFKKLIKEYNTFAL